MKLTVFFLMLTAILLGSSICAVAQDSSDTFQIGNRQIVIPVPAGFVEASSQLASVRERLTATEAAGNDFLASHLPKADFQLLKAGEVIDPTFYTKVSVSKRLRAVNSTQADFAAFADAFKKYFPAYTDPNSPTLKNSLRRASEGLSAVNGEKTTFRLDNPHNVGEIVNDQNAFGIIILSQVTMKVGDAELSRLMLAGISAIRVREKIMFIYTYNRYEKQADIDDLKTFSANWLKQIAAANK